MKILVTGGAGFIGSHVAEFYAKKDEEVFVYDNLSRAELLCKDDKNGNYNWNYLKKYKNITLIRGDVRDLERLKDIVSKVDIVIHTAGQTAVTTSITNPLPDFTVNVCGSFNVLEAIRLSKKRPYLVFCSTNKVYGENVNEIEVKKLKTRYEFAEGKYSKKGIPETLSIDHCKHTPYGCSKLAADLYMQDYAQLYDLKIGVFRMSCIYGTRQFGFEDQGWIAWFTIATLLKKPITIYGDGRQVRDILYVSDLVNAYDAFLKSDVKFGVFNTGGGVENTLSLLELLDKIQVKTKKKSKISFEDWRPSDQKVYISDISKIKKQLNWKPEVAPAQGIEKMIEWVEENKNIF